MNDATERGLLDLEMHTLDGHLTTEDGKARWVINRLSDLAVAFSETKMAEPIILASQWLFNSHAGRNEMLSFVQAMVVLEILLDDKKTSEQIGIGQLMRNLCAYLIGGSQEERTQLLEDFDKIYKVRSQIFHTGKHRLTAEELILSTKRRWMSRRVISKELDLLKANPKTNP